MDSLFLARHPQLFRFAGTSMGIDATGAQVAMPTYTVTRARIGDMTFAPTGPRWSTCPKTTVVWT